MSNVTHYGRGAKPEPEQHDAHVWALRAVEIAGLWGLPASVTIDPIMKWPLHPSLSNVYPYGPYNTGKRGGP